MSGLDVVEVVNLSPVVTTSLADAHLHVIETLDRREDDPEHDPSTTTASWFRGTQLRRKLQLH